MSRESEKRLEEWFTWYREHAPYMESCDDPRKAAQFFRRATNGLFDCVACLQQDVQQLEQRRRNQLAGIWIPPSVRARR